MPVLISVETGLGEQIFTLVFAVVCTLHVYVTRVNVRNWWVRARMFYVSFKRQIRFLLSADVNFVFLSLLTYWR